MSGAHTQRFVGETLSWDRVEGALEVRLDRAPCNEIGTATLAELERLVAYLAAGAGGARAVIVYSDVKAGFCAGADLRELYAGLVEAGEGSAVGRAARLARRVLDRADLRGGVTERAAGAVRDRVVRLGVRRFIERIHAVFEALDRSPIPVIAAVHGVCFGGGFELALTADLIVADRSARFCLPELRLGLVPGFGAIPRLSRDVGNAVVRDLLLTGRSLNGERAQALGIASQVVPKGEALGAARRLAGQLGRFDADVVAAAKAFVKPHPERELARERETFVRLVTSPVVLSALRRFVQSEDPRPYLP